MSRLDDIGEAMDYARKFQKLYATHVTTGENGEPLGALIERVREICVGEILKKSPPSELVSIGPLNASISLLGDYDNLPGGGLIYTGLGGRHRVRGTVIGEYRR